MEIEVRCFHDCQGAMSGEDPKVFDFKDIEAALILTRKISSGATDYCA